MPHRKISALDDKIRKNLPVGAQRIYMEAYNAAWEQYASPSKRRAGTSREETASRVAWTAVKTKYKKNSSGKWVQK